MGCRRDGIDGTQMYNCTYPAVIESEADDRNTAFHSTGFTPPKEASQGMSRSFLGDLQTSLARDVAPR